MNPFSIILWTEGYETPVPDDYADLPQLKGRATVEMTLQKPEGEMYNIEGTLFKEAKMKMIIDGYTGKPTMPSEYLFLVAAISTNISHISIYILIIIHAKHRSLVVTSLN